MFEAEEMKKHYVAVIAHIAYLCEKVTESNEFEIDDDRVLRRIANLKAIMLKTCSIF